MDAVGDGLGAFKLLLFSRYQATAPSQLFLSRSSLLERRFVEAMPIMPGLEETFEKIHEVRSGNESLNLVLNCDVVGLISHCDPDW